MPQMTQDERIECAIAALKSDPKLSTHKAAKIFDVPRTTLRNRIQGKTTVAIRRQRLQKLTQAEEQNLVNTLYILFNWGWPASIKFFEHLVTNLQVSKGDTTPLGKKLWYDSSTPCRLVSMYLFAGVRRTRITFPGISHC
jgi:hypothetical protein